MNLPSSGVCPIQPAIAEDGLIGIAGDDEPVLAGGLGAQRRESAGWSAAGGRCTPLRAEEAPSTPRLAARAKGALEAVTARSLARG